LAWATETSLLLALRPDHAEALYDRFVTLCRARVARVETGLFRAEMKVEVTAKQVDQRIELYKKQSLGGSDKRYQQTLKTYGLTQADYDRLVAAQNGLCAICERRPPVKLCVDHCHATRRLRFLLCNKCNSGLGCFEDDPDLLRRALAYAEFWQKLRMEGRAVRLVPDPKSRRGRRCGHASTSRACPVPAESEHALESLGGACSCRRTGAHHSAP